MLGLGSRATILHPPGSSEVAILKRKNTSPFPVGHSTPVRKPARTRPGSLTLTYSCKTLDSRQGWNRAAAEVSRVVAVRET